MRRCSRQMVALYTPDCSFAMARKFFYDTGEEKVGPVTGHELVRLRAAGQISDDTWVRRADSATWRPLSSVDLRQEEDEEANPSFWRVLSRIFSWQSLLLAGAVFIVFITLAVYFISFAWPFFLILLAVWLLNRISKN